MFKIFKSKRKQKVLDITQNLDMGNIPKHIAIIMDGNGRWAKQRNLPRTFGHRAGVEAIRAIVRECSKLGVKYLTLYAFSTENWKRSNDEVGALMKLLVEYLRGEIEELHENKVVVNSIGDISKLPTICQQELARAYNKTKDNKGLILNLALNYGGRDELLQAFKAMHKDLSQGTLSLDGLNEDLVNNYLYTSGMPDPDLIIRPSGEKRLSNFMLWQCAYAEFWTSDVNWPDFKEEHLHKAISDFQNRDRRFGGIK